MDFGSIVRRALRHRATHLQGDRRQEEEEQALKATQAKYVSHRREIGPAIPKDNR